MGIIDEQKINGLLSTAKAPNGQRLSEILAKAELKKGLELGEVAELLKVTDQKMLGQMFASSRKVKEDIYGNRLVFFAPIYLSSFCVNDCSYCGFHCSNKGAERKKLTSAEVAQQVRELIKMGHKRLLVEVGEDPERNTIDYVVDSIRTIYATKEGKGEIRRVNVNIAATGVDDYKKLKKAGIGTYQLFQETYHRDTYKKLHEGPKADYDRQITAHERAFKAGIDDLGIGVLFGLYDYKFEVLALVSHAQYMDRTLGVGPHTISVPRFCPADTVNLELPHQVGDADFLKVISVLRLAVPYTGMIISTRETPEMRAKAFEIGITQASAASATSPGGYGKEKNAGAQFEVHDSRNVEEILSSVIERGYLPSFCTACYRSNRTGDRFMELAKAGSIHYLCKPNAILTFKEFLVDYASPKLKAIGEELIAKEASEVDEERRPELIRRLRRIEKGERDLFF